MKVAVGSTNPVKVGAVRSVIERVWPDAAVVGLDVHTGVRAMPMSDEECQVGARNRATAARQLATADLGVGIEAGVHEENGVLMLTAWTVIVNGRGLEGVGRSGRPGFTGAPAGSRETRFRRAGFPCRQRCCP